MVSITDIPTEKATWQLLITLFGYIPVLAILLSIRYQVKINDEGFHYRFFPFVRWKCVRPAEVATLSPVHTSLLGQFRKGYRHNRFTKTMRFNIAGKGFIQMQLTNGYTLHIGSMHPDELHFTLQKLLSPKS